MTHLQWETTASPEEDAASPVRDAVSPTGDLLASPNFGICDTTQQRYSYILGVSSLQNVIFLQNLAYLKPTDINKITINEY
jgi:hypothetical protein